MAFEATPLELLACFKMNSSSHLLVPESPQMTVFNLLLGGTIFTEGGHYSPVNNVRGDHFWGGHCTL